MNVLKSIDAVDSKINSRKHSKIIQLRTKITPKIELTKSSLKLNKFINVSAEKRHRNIENVRNGTVHIKD